MNNEKDWSTLAARFDELQEYVAGKESTLAIKRKIRLLPGLGRVLELGCGSGGYTSEVAMRAETVIATDISDDMVRVATDRLKDIAHVVVEKKDCYQTKYDDASFDTVVMANLIHVVEYPERVINEAWRLLKNQGRMVIVSFTLDGMKDEDVGPMFTRYLKSFGKPPKGGTPFSLAQLAEFVKARSFRLIDAELIGDKTKAVFLVAERNVLGV